MDTSQRNLTLSIDEVAILDAQGRLDLFDALTRLGKKDMDRRFYEAHIREQDILLGKMDVRDVEGVFSSRRRFRDVKHAVAILAGLYDDALDSAGIGPKSNRAAEIRRSEVK